MDLWQNDMLEIAINRYHNAICNFYDWNGEISCIQLIDTYNRIYVLVGDEKSIKSEIIRYEFWRENILPLSSLSPISATQVHRYGKNHLIFEKKGSLDRSEDFKFY